MDSRGDKQKYYCECITEAEQPVYITVRATNHLQASELAHKGYKIQYVLEVLSHAQLEQRKKHLKKGTYASKAPQLHY